MELAIVLIVIGVVVAARLENKKGKKKRQGDAGQSSQAPAQMRDARRASQAPAQMGGAGRASQAPAQMGDAGRASQAPAQMGDAKAGQQELKRRLQQKYGKVPDRTVQERKPQQDTYDILSRAIASVQEDAADELHPKNGGAAGVPADSGLLEMTGDSDLMRQVNDLIIMGYPAKLSYERDFLAEGIQMMNQYQSMEL